ncbi:metallophosphoesterase family protein, partial [candidate division KSB1 bacterium]|nr:metallophosphoesterase family protein [candidate division KSB1 bacterium]
MQRRKFLQSMGLLSILPAPTLAETLLNPKTGVARLTAAPQLASEFYTAPYLLYPEKQALTVAWVTSKDCFSHVEYGTGDDLNQIAKSSHHGLIDAYTHVHKIRLSNLEPGRRYRYRVVSTENLGEENGEILFGDTRTSESFEFDTLEQDPTEFNFMVFNDVHANSTIMHSLYNQAIEKNTDLVFLNGDLVDSIEDEYNFCRQALNPLAQDFAHRIPLIYVRGNHECRGPHARNFNQYLHSENDNFYYSFSYGAVHFTVLDSGEYLSDSNPTTGDRLRFEPYRQLQADWLREE